MLPSQDLDWFTWNATVCGTPLSVGYLIRKDDSDVLRAVLRESVVYRFGIGVGIIVALFLSLSQVISRFPGRRTLTRVSSCYPARNVSARGVALRSK